MTRTEPPSLRESPARTILRRLDQGRNGFGAEDPLSAMYLAALRTTRWSCGPCKE